MQKQINSILFVAGTCIGGGVIALPIVLAKLGIIPSFIIMILSWLLTYYPSLVSVELNLHSDRGLTLSELAQKFSGRTAQIISEISVKLLSYSLLAVYFSGGSSIIRKLLSVYWNYSPTEIIVQSSLALIVAGILMFPMKIISKINGAAFIGFLIVFLTLTANILCNIDIMSVPWMVEPSGSNVLSVITVVFTSFGYQIIFHNLRNYCGKNVKMLRRAFLYGSIIPAVVYIMWTGGVLSVIYKSDTEFFSLMIAGKINAGDLVDQLSRISQFPQFQVAVWWMSIFAIVTSIFGVGLSLVEALESSIKNFVPKVPRRKLLVVSMTIAPAYVIAAIIPNAFIKILEFAGTILVLIAILLPIWIFLGAHIEKIYLKELKKYPLILCAIIGIGVILVDIFCK